MIALLCLIGGFVGGWYVAKKYGASINWPKV
jgi:uncharacterized protein YneF (UPF0154 family)